MSSTAAPVPNVVFIISDHHRWDYMGCVGADFVRTPNLDGLAGARHRGEPDVLHGARMRAIARCDNVGTLPHEYGMLLPLAPG